MSYLTDHYNTVFGMSNPENETCEDMEYEEGFIISRDINNIELKKHYNEHSSDIPKYLNKVLPNVHAKLKGGNGKQTFITIIFSFGVVGESNTDIEHGFEEVEEKIDNAIYELIK